MSINIDWRAPDNAARLRFLWDSGLSYDRIAKQFGTTKNSVTGAVHRAKLAARPSPIIRHGNAPSRRNKPKRAAKLTLIAASEAVPSAIVPITAQAAPMAVIGPTLVNAAPSYLAIPTPSPRRCQFPLWGNSRPARHKFCEAPVTRGSYCDEHAARCYVAPVRRAEGAAA